MAEGRMLKKVISRSRRLAELNTDSARLLYTWLLPHLDVEGRFYADPAIIKGAVMPRIKSMTTQKIKSYLDDMAKNELINLYENDGDLYLEFRKFEDHQSLRKDREAKSIIPGPCKDSSTTPGQLQESSRTTPPEDKIREVNINTPPIVPPTGGGDVVSSKKLKNPKKDFYPSWLDLVLWQDFIKYRKTIKAPLTERAEKILLTELEKLINTSQGTQKAIIEQSIMSGKWPGLFPVKVRDNSSVITPYKPQKLPSEEERVSPEEIRKTREGLKKKGIKTDERKNH